MRHAALLACTLLTSAGAATAAPADDAIGRHDPIDDSAHIRVWDESARVPAPGAFALLLTAGVVGLRRRRR